MLAPIAPQSNISDDVRDSIIENSYKAIADKIWDILDKVRDKTVTAQRRWIWELMQNAKDTPNTHKRVSILVELTADALLFAHNGDAFEVKNLTSLVQQVSRKDSTNAQEDVTGKFGTGFISTHMLADQIEVQGVVKRPGGLRRAFQLVLDRRAKKPEELVEPIKKALMRVQQLDDEMQFALLPDYEAKRALQEDVLDTLFRYPLGAEHPDSTQWKAARQGLKDLEVTLPATLVNIPHIKQVTVKLDGHVRLYRCRKLESFDKVERYAVDVLDEQGQVVTSRCFLAFEQGDLRLLAEVKNFEDLTLLPEPGGKPVPKEERSPTLFRDFPLVGSDTYQLPFQLHGKTFHPQEARDGLWLNEGDKAKHNRQLLEQTVSAALLFSQWLVDHQAKNLYRLAFTRVPMEAQLDLLAQQWYRDHVQKPWRSGLLDLNLVEVADGTRTNLRLARVPRYRAQNPDNKQNRTFGELASAFLGLRRVPNLDLLDEWIEALGVDGDLKEYATWEQPIFLDLAGLFKLVAATERLENLPVAGDETEKLTWLNNLFLFADQQQELGKMLKEYAVVPNQRGELRHFLNDKLQAERQEDYIPEQVLTILNELGVDWPTRLMHRKVELPGQEGEKLGLKDAAGQLTALLNATEKKPGQTPTSFLDRTDLQPLDVLTRLLSLTTSTAKETSVRRRLVQFAADVLNFEPSLEMVAEGTKLTENLEYTFEAAESLLAQLVNQEVEKLGNLKGLQDQLQCDRSCALQWVNEYVNLLHESAKHRELLTKGGSLLPDWQDEFQPYSKLHNFGTEEQVNHKEGMCPLVELLAKLSSDSEEDDWRPKLLADGVDLRLPLTLSFEQLGTKLTARTEAIRMENKIEEYRLYTKELMTLIEWCHQHKQKEDGLTNYIRLFADRAGIMFYMLNVELSGNSGVVMKLLKQPEQLARLATLSELGLDDATLQKVVEHARILGEQVKAEKNNFDTGRQVEKLFLEALKGTGLEGKLNLHYQGSGDCDYVVRNKAGDEFYLEVKSYLEGTEKYPLHIALSQATTASKVPDNFALCVVARPLNLDEMLPHDVAERIKYVPVHDAGFAHIVENWDKLENIAKEDAAADMRLEVEFATSRVRMSHKLVDKLKKGADGHGLDELVKVVKARLGILTPTAEEPVVPEL